MGFLEAQAAIAAAVPLAASFVIDKPVSVALAPDETADEVT